MIHYVKTTIADVRLANGKTRMVSTCEYIGTDYTGPVGQIEDNSKHEVWVDEFETKRDALQFIRENKDA